MLIAEKSEGQPPTPTRLRIQRLAPWIRIILGVLLAALALWYMTRDVTLAELTDAVARARPGYILLGFAIIALTTLAKTWRWQFLFRPRADAPRFSALFWSLTLGQLVNTAIPFLRLGEVARAYDLGRQTQRSKATALGTLVVEKVLDLLMLAATLALLLPFLVIPSFVVDSGIVTGLVGLLMLAALYIAAHNWERLRPLLEMSIRWLPAAWQQRLLLLAAAGFAGLAALRSRRALVAVLTISAFIAFLSVLTPYVLFAALNIPLGLVAASALHVVLSVGTLPPSTPAKLGIFELLVAFMLRFFEVENSALILTYTIVFHTVVVLPQIVFGIIAVGRANLVDRS